MASLRSPITYDDDLYSGYNEYPTALSTKDLENDEIVQEALRSRYGKRPIVSNFFITFHSISTWCWE